MSVGTFCDSDSECHSTDEELSCREQPDISRFSRVCMAKLGEGATCGHSSLFDLFRRAEDVSNYCKKGLVCRTVGYDVVAATAHFFAEKLPKSI